MAAEQADVLREAAAKRRNGWLLPASLVAGFDTGSRSIGKFSIERFPVFDTAAQELRPVGDRDVLRNRFGKQAPKLRVMPAQIVPAAVAMSADAVSQPHHFGNQFFPRPVLEI